jgi:hypothetical protein
MGFVCSQFISEQIRFIRTPNPYDIELFIYSGWDDFECKHRCFSVGFVYKSVFILPCSIIVKTSKNYNFSVEYRKSTWRQKPDPIAIHFNSTEHSVNDYEIVALEKICGDNSYRETIEKLWMKDRLIMN